MNQIAIESNPVMQSTPIPIIVSLVPLLSVCAVACLFLTAAHLFFRPELNSGRILTENVSRIIGVSTILASVLFVETWRGAANGMAVSVLWLWIDTAVIAACCGLVVIALWRTKGDPRKNSLSDPDEAQRIINAAREAVKHG